MVIKLALCMGMNGEISAVSEYCCVLERSCLFIPLNILSVRGINGIVKASLLVIRTWFGKWVKGGYVGTHLLLLWEPAHCSTSTFICVDVE